jgi:broad specificity phosphatase PhoE
MELFLIRHGESTNNALEDWTQRVEDPLLTERGERQAERTAAHLAAGCTCRRRCATASRCWTASTAAR